MFLGSLMFESSLLILNIIHSAGGSLFSLFTHLQNNLYSCQNHCIFFSSITLSFLILFNILWHYTFLSLDIIQRFSTMLIFVALFLYVYILYMYLFFFTATLCYHLTRHPFPNFLLVQLQTFLWQRSFHSSKQYLHHLSLGPLSIHSFGRLIYFIIFFQIECVFSLHYFILVFNFLFPQYFFPMIHLNTCKMAFPSIRTSHYLLSTL